MKRMNVKTYISNTYIPIGSYMVIRKALMQAGIVKNRGRAFKYSFYQRKEPAGHKGHACRKRSAYRHEPRGNQRV